MIYKKLFIILSLFISMVIVAQASEKSFYQVPLHWKSESNVDFSLGSMKGKKVLITMAYTSCQGTCPLIVSKLKKIEKLFKEKNVSVEVVVITYDPLFDTPGRTTDYYREKMGIKNSNWHFLTGSEGDTRKVSMLLGIKFSRNPESGIIIHDNKILLMDEKGDIIKSIEGLDADESVFIK